MFGRSFGSYAATVLSNAIADRLRGVVVGLPCFEPGFTRIFEEASPTYKNRFMFMAGYEDEAKFDKFIAGFDLRTRVSNLALSVDGSRRRARRVVADQARLRSLQEGAGAGRDRRLSKRAACTRAASVVAIGPHWYAVMADWLSARVRDRLPIEGTRYRYVTASGKVEQRPML